MTLLDPITYKDLQTATRAIDELAVNKRIRLEFSAAIRQIAEIAKSDVTMSLNLYELIENALEQRVTSIARQYYDKGFRDGRSYEALQHEPYEN